jgi:hypothetical protein
MKVYKILELDWSEAFLDRDGVEDELWRNEVPVHCTQGVARLNAENFPLLYPLLLEKFSSEELNEFKYFTVIPG